MLTPYYIAVNAPQMAVAGDEDPSITMEHGETAWQRHRPKATAAISAAKVATSQRVKWQGSGD